MIERYARPHMKRVWSEEGKYEKWLIVELAACEAWAQEGVVPADDMERLRGATYNHERLSEILEGTRHEMTAFLSSITEGIGPEGRWLWVWSHCSPPPGCGRVVHSLNPQTISHPIPVPC